MQEYPGIRLTSDEIQQIEQRLGRMERMESLGCMAAGIAHDLNNAMGPMLSLPILVRGEMEALLEVSDIPDAMAEKLKEFIEDFEIVEESVRHARGVVNDLQVFSSSGSSNRKPINLAELAEKITREWQCGKCYRDYGSVKLEYSAEENLPAVKGSKTHLRRVIVNLLKNSVEAMPDGGTVRLRVYSECIKQLRVGYEPLPMGKYVCISVKDTGIGISSDVLHYIFEPFFSKKADKSKSGGGLGLPVVHGIIKGHGGYIDIRSNPGDGTEFLLYLPAIKEMAIKSDGEPVFSISDEMRGNGEHILVVDDNPAQLFIIRRILETAGYRVRLATSGKEAVDLLGLDAQTAEKAIKQKFDAVILDIVMPEPDGFSLHQMITSYYADLPVMLVSGQLPTARLRQLLDHGVVWLSKPFTPESVLTALKGLI